MHLCNQLPLKTSFVYMINLYHVINYNILNTISFINKKSKLIKMWLPSLKRELSIDSTSNKFNLKILKKKMSILFNCNKDDVWIFILWLILLFCDYYFWCWITDIYDGHWNFWDIYKNTLFLILSLTFTLLLDETHVGLTALCGIYF